MKLEFAPLNLSEILNKSIEQNKIYLEKKMQRSHLHDKRLDS